MAYMKKIFPQVREFFFDDDTFTANLPRAREIAKKLGPLGVDWSCNSRANLDYDTIKSFKDNGLRLFLVGYESGNDETLTRIKKGLTTDEIYANVEKFYHRYYLRPKPILRIIKTMLEDKDVCVRRLREGYEFFKSMAQRRSDLAAAKAAV